MLVLRMKYCTCTPRDLQVLKKMGVMIMDEEENVDDGDEFETSSVGPM